MSKPDPAAPSSPGASSSAAPALEPGFETALQAFWDRNRQLILGACVVALLAIVVREGLQYVAASRERTIQADYAKAGDQPAQLAAFAGSHAGHPLAGVAWLQVADDKFSKGDYAGAATAYQQAAGSLKNEALLGRAKLGAAVSQVRGNDRTAGEAALKAIGADTTLLAGVRAEATYHLATLALDAGRVDEARQLVEEVNRIDPSSPWNQRATALLTSLPAAGAPASAAPSISFKPVEPAKTGK